MRHLMEASEEARTWPAPPGSSTLQMGQQRITREGFMRRESAKLHE